MNEVKKEYLKLRKAGNNRADSVLKMQQRYSDELKFGIEDDGLLFWIGLADAQYEARELCIDIAESATTALQQIAQKDWNITPGDILRRTERYQQAPQPEKKFGKAKKKFRCNWAIGDTFAHKLSGENAEAINVAGKYVLFRKVDEIEFGNGELHPVVTISLWNQKPLPRSVEEFCSVPMLSLGYGRFGHKKSAIEYRAEILIRSTTQLKQMNLEYVGRFTDVPMPADEVAFHRAGLIKMLLPKQIDYECILFLNMDQYIRNNLK